MMAENGGVMKKIKTCVADLNFVIASIVARTVVLTCSLLVAMCAPAMADENQVDIEAELTACASPCVIVPGSEGELEYNAEFLDDGITVKEVKLKAVVTIHVPNIFRIVATNSGAAGLVVIDLTRPNPSGQLAEPYATCTMVLKKAKATFLTYALTLSAKLKKGQFVVGKKSQGFCDIDLITPDVQTGIPAIQDGDVAFVSVNGTDILSSLPPLPSPMGDGCIEACCGCWDY
jgi:hypothetical protein